MANTFPGSSIQYAVAPAPSTAGGFCRNSRTASQCASAPFGPGAANESEAPAIGMSACSRTVMVTTAPNVPPPPPLSAQYRSACGPSGLAVTRSPAAVTTSAKQPAKDFLSFMESPEGQAIYAENGFRPVPGVSGVKVPEVKGANDPSNPFPDPKKLYTVDKDLGGWDSANSTFFNDGSDGNPVGIISQLIADSGSKAEDD